MISHTSLYFINNLNLFIIKNNIMFLLIIKFFKKKKDKINIFN
jgi:hypothetical protein